MRIPHKLLLALPVLLALYFYGLTRMGMVGPDEPRYAAVGREMVESGDWITPRLWGKPWFEKPALLYWMTAAGFRSGLGPDLAPRLPVALLSAWFLVFYFLRMRREFGEHAAWYSSVMLATSAGWLAYSHVAVTEIPLAATFSASMMLALPWVRSGGRRGLFLGGIMLGLAILAKGLVPLVLALPLFWVGRNRWRDLLAFCLVAAAVAAPWYVLCYLQNGWPFIEVFFVQHHFGRFVSAELRHVQPWWFYLPVTAGLLFPWTPTVACLAGVDWKEPRRFLLLSWFGFGLVFFSASSNKLPGYVLPLLPAITALTGIRLAEMPVRLVLPFATLLAALIPAANVLPVAIASGLTRALDDFSWARLAVTLTFATVCAGLAVWVERRENGPVFDLTAATTAGAMLWLICVTFPDIDRTASARPQWERMLRPAQPQCIEGMRRNFRYGLNYYAGRELPSCSDAER